MFKVIKCLMPILIILLLLTIFSGAVNDVVGQPMISYISKSWIMGISLVLGLILIVLSMIIFWRKESSRFLKEKADDKEEEILHYKSLNRQRLARSNKYNRRNDDVVDDYINPVVGYIGMEHLSNSGGSGEYEPYHHSSGGDDYGDSGCDSGGGGCDDGGGDGD